ncbi:MAG: glycogen synthase GlgA [Paracoccaceae bacterium]|nr:glycogen synthase GlgA [Paracoccaceae bacterium]
MNTVLSVASEVAPLIKTGGLADVVGALPAAMKPEGWRLITLVPGYPQVMERLENPRRVRRERYCFGGPGNVLADEVAGLELLVLEAPHLYDRPGSIYLGADGLDWPDNPERFAALSWVAARLAANGIDGIDVDVLHAHDWQGALAPLYLQEMAADDAVGTLLTVHNIAFHGWAEPAKLRAMRLPRALYTHELLEYHGRVNALKAGLVTANRISTVSPTYARELLTPEYGMGLDGVIRTREADLTGILNGIDEVAWDPAKDPAITPYKSPRGKAKNKTALLKEFDLKPGKGPLCVVISRLTEQKGLDLLLQCLHVLAERDARLALLGTGEAWLEEAWRKAAAEVPGVAVKIGYDEALSHRMIAGADAILIPSRFEPCGLTQLYGLRYGTMPLVADTGGLSDTVIDANVAALSMGVATGIKFNPVAAPQLREALNRLCDIYDSDDGFVTMQKNGMAQPVGWAASAPRYAALYESLRCPD